MVQGQVLDPNQTSETQLFVAKISGITWKDKLEAGGSYGIDLPVNNDKIQRESPGDVVCALDPA